MIQINIARVVEKVLSATVVEDVIHVIVVNVHSIQVNVDVNVVIVIVGNVLDV
jgi:hypothetical protein